MTRVLFAALALCLSATAFGGDVVRDIAGRQVHLDPDGTVVLFWSMNDLDAVSELVQLADVERRGWPVLAVNTDGPTEKSRVRPYLHRHGLSALPTVLDADASLMARLHGERGDALIVHSGLAHARAASPSALFAPVADETAPAIASESPDEGSSTDAVGSGGPPRPGEGEDWVPAVTQP